MDSPGPNNRGYLDPIGARAEQPNARVGAFEGENIFSLDAFFRVLWERLWIIVLVTLVLVGLATGSSLVQTPKYEASVKILIGQEQERGEALDSLGAEVQGLQQITQTMAEAVNTGPIAEGAIRQLNLQMTVEDFQKNLKAEQIAPTQFIQVDYEDTSPERAQQVANTVGDVFSEQVAEVRPSENLVTATVWERARLPEDPVSPSPVRNGLVALAMGVMLGVALAFLLEYLDVRRGLAEKGELASGVPTPDFPPEYERPVGKKEQGR
jgi:capsular polysaccharide biosynthesis protein